MLCVAPIAAANSDGIPIAQYFCNANNHYARCRFVFSPSVRSETNTKYRVRSVRPSVHVGIVAVLIINNLVFKWTVRLARCSSAHPSGRLAIARRPFVAGRGRQLQKFNLIVFN